MLGPGEGGTGPDSRGPHIVDAPPNLIALLTHCGQLIIVKISKFNTIRCPISRLNAQNLISPLGSLQRYPRSPSCI